MGRPGSIATMSRTKTGYYTESREIGLEEGRGSGNIATLEELPRMPDLGLQTLYSSDTNTEATPAQSSEGSATAPPPTFTREDAKAYYKSMLAESSAAGSTERMSALSAWTESTTRTSTQGGPGRESMEQAGLSPPPGFANSSNLRRVTQTPPGPVTTTTTTRIVSATESPGAKAGAKEELSAVQEQI